MQYGDIKRVVLELLDQYSIAGSEISPAYNHQSDDIHRIPNLINQALTDIRTGVLPERAVYQLDDPESNQEINQDIYQDANQSNQDANQNANGENQENPGVSNRSGAVWNLHTLPADFWRLRSGGVRKLDSQNAPTPVNQYQLLGKKSILTPPGRYLIEYDRYPGQLPADPNDNYMLDEDPEVIQAACLYAAAMIAAREDDTLYAALSNAYESRLARMIPAVTAEVRTIQDAYSF